MKKPISQGLFYVPFRLCMLDSGITNKVMGKNIRVKVNNALQRVVVDFVDDIIYVETGW